MPLLETDRLFVEAGNPDDGGSNPGIIGLDDPNATFRDVLMADEKGIAIDHRLDHRRFQEA
jgi:hypothetical protein